MGKGRWIASAAIHRHAYTRPTTHRGDGCEKVEAHQWFYGPSWVHTSRIPCTRLRQTFLEVSLPLLPIFSPCHANRMTTPQQFHATPSHYYRTSGHGSQLRYLSTSKPACAPATPKKPSQAPEPASSTSSRTLPLKAFSPDTVDVSSTRIASFRRSSGRRVSPDQAAANILLAKARRDQEALEAKRRERRAEAAREKEKESRRKAELQRRLAQEEARKKAEQERLWRIERVKELERERARREEEEKRAIIQRELQQLEQRNRQLADVKRVIQQIYEAYANLPSTDWLRIEAAGLVLDDLVSSRGVLADELTSVRIVWSRTVFEDITRLLVGTMHLLDEIKADRITGFEYMFKRILGDLEGTGNQLDELESRRHLMGELGITQATQFRIKQMQQAAKLESAARNAEFWSNLEKQKAQLEMEQAYDSFIDQLSNYGSYRELYKPVEHASWTTERTMERLVEHYQRKYQLWVRYAQEFRDAEKNGSLIASSVISTYLPEWGQTVQEVVGACKKCTPQTVLSDLAYVENYFKHELNFWSWHREKHRQFMRTFLEMGHNTREATHLLYLNDPDGGNPDLWARRIWRRNISSLWRVGELKLYEAHRLAKELVQLPPSTPQPGAGFTPSFPFDQLDQLDQRKLEEFGGTAYRSLLAQSGIVIAKSSLIAQMMGRFGGIADRLSLSKLLTGSLREQECFRLASPIQEFQRRRPNAFRNWQKDVDKLTNRASRDTLHKKLYLFQQHYNKIIIPLMAGVDEILYDVAGRKEKSGALDNRAEKLKEYVTTELERLRRLVRVSSSIKAIGRAARIVASEKRTVTRQVASEKGAATPTVASERPTAKVIAKSVSASKMANSKAQATLSIAKSQNVKMPAVRWTSGTFGPSWNRKPHFSTTFSAVEESTAGQMDDNPLMSSATHSLHASPTAPETLMSVTGKRLDMPSPFGQNANLTVGEDELPGDASPAEQCTASKIGEQPSKLKKLASRRRRKEEREKRRREERQETSNTIPGDKVLQRPASTVESRPTGKHVLVKQAKSSTDHSIVSILEASGKQVNAIHSKLSSLRVDEPRLSKKQRRKANLQHQRKHEAPMILRPDAKLSATLAYPVGKDEEQAHRPSNSGRGGLTPSQSKQAAIAFHPSLVALKEDAIARGQRTASIDEHPPLTFHIPKEDLKKAMQSSKSVSSAYWSHSLYRGPEGEQVIVHYCRSKQTAEKVAQLFLGQPVLGFDIEWKPMAKTTSGIKNNVSLIQLASENRIALFQLAMHKGETADEILPSTLRLILEDPNVVKAGVAVRSDFKRLTTHLDIAPAGLMELSHLHNLVTYSASDPAKVTKRLVGLTRQVEMHLQLPLSKGEVRTSDWSRELTHDQCFYAAADAYAGLRIFHALETKRKAMDPVPPRPAFAELLLPLRPEKPTTRSKLKLGELAATAEAEPSLEESSVDDNIEELNLNHNAAALHKETPVKNSEIRHTDGELQILERLYASHWETNVSDTYLKDDVATHTSEDEISSNTTLVGGMKRSTKQGLSESTPSDADKDRNDEDLIKSRNENPKRSSENQESREDLLDRLEVQLEEADQWAKEKAARIDKSRATGVPQWSRSTAGKAAFRAYALWEHHQLSIDEVAKLVGIKAATVATYVAECLQYDSLDCSNYIRVRDLLERVPYGRQARYRQLKEYALDVTKGQGRPHV